MDALFSLSGNKCVLLATHLASEANIPGLKALCAARRDAFEKEKLLRILLTYLPETTEPAAYTAFAQDIAEDRVIYGGEDAPPINSVTQLSEAQAKSRVKHLDLLPLRPSSRRVGDDVPIFEQFLVHRAYRIDEEAQGQLPQVAGLVDPYLDEYPFLRTWFISSVLPLLRFAYEYYPEADDVVGLERFDGLSGGQGVELLLSRSQQSAESGQGGTYNGARDMRSLVGPWMYGSNERKRRKLNNATGTRRASLTVAAARDVQRIEEDGAASEDLNTEHEWEHAFDWLARKAAHDFPLVTETIEEWGGPSDVDMGGYEDPNEPAVQPEVERKLHIQYVQAAYAAAYAVESDTSQTIEGAHSLLVRLADLMEFEPPPDLATSVEMLPKIDDQSWVLTETSSAALLPNVLLKQGHPLTTPNTQTYALLQLFVFSAYLLAGLGQPISIVNIAKHRFQANADEQLALLQKLLHHASTGPRKDEEQWSEVRNRLLWLWGWGMNAASGDGQFGAGILGKIDRSIFAREIMQTLLSTGCYSLVKKLWLNGRSSGASGLIHDAVENVIINTAMQFYDSASNGNRTRGSMKKASEIFADFRASFPGSTAFRRCEALLAATHSLSFYSLTLQHGVPFQPVNIRVSKDPLTLLNKVLEQNPKSYTKLDDLISIGTNLVAAGLPEHSASDSDDPPPTSLSAQQLQAAKTKAERRVIGMAIEQALHEDDFETAYSYVVTRLNPAAAASTAATDGGAGTEAEDDDLSWRAAFIAGRHRSASDTASSHVSSGSAQLRKPGVRRLEQRMELLSQALLLAPPPHLPEVLAAWRRCEEEMEALVKQEADEEDAFNDRADRRLPGGFGPSLSPVQTRREVGRGAVEEAPMGLFDVMGSAANAFSRTVHGPRQKAAPAGQGTDLDASMGSIESDDANMHGGAERVRKRDMMANAATGALASGLGWVLGESPRSR